MHVGIVGTGRLGRAIAFALLEEWYVDEMSLADIAPGLAAAVEEELRHAASAMGRDVEFHSYEDSSEISGADILIVVAGKPRTADMSRRDLAEFNGKVMRNVAESVYPNNKGAKYVVVTNPVDAMATLFWRVTRAEYVISTGTHLDSVRFRSELAKKLGVPVSRVEAYVAGEHGPNSVFLWSMTKVDGHPVEEYASSRGLELDKSGVEAAVKEVARKVIARLGATIYGPAASFREIVRSIALNQGRVLSVASPLKIGGVKVCVGVPQKVARSLGPTLLGMLAEEERRSIEEAAKAIHETYLAAARSAGLE